MFETKMKPGMSKPDREDAEDLYLPKSKTLITIICLVRILCLCGWVGGMGFATLQIFLATEDLLQWPRASKLNTGYFTEFLNRGRDDSDYEWEMFSSLMFTKLIYWYSAYLVLSKYFPGIYVMTLVSPLMSFLFLALHVGTFPTAILFLQPCSYWFLLKIRSKLIIWVCTIGIILYMNTTHINTVVGVNDDTRYHFIIVLSWNCCRCVSFVFEYWDRSWKETDSFESLWSGICYCFYFPLTVTGPLIMFDQYEKHVRNQLPKASSKIAFKSKGTMLLSLCRVIFVGILLELILHYFYVRPLAFSHQALEKVNLWVVCGSVYWIAQLFTLKYQVMYGLPSFITEVDGILMHSLPPSPGYIHRYSVIWKDFDRGLYYFLIRCIYIPVVNFLNSKRRITTEKSKFMASVVTFAYIYVWHGTSYFIFLWTSLNFLGITIERIGSCIKREVDKRWKLSPISWDFIIEPIVTAPLAGMSLLTASIFCGSLQSAKNLSMRLWHEMGDCYYVLIFLYCLAQVAVTKRTWNQFIDGIKKNQKTQ